MNTTTTMRHTVTSRSTKGDSVSSAADMKSTTNGDHIRTSRSTKEPPASSTAKEKTKKKRRVVIGILNWGNAANPREKKWMHKYR